jgi:hypothetical protein
MNAGTGLKIVAGRKPGTDSRSKASVVPPATFLTPCPDARDSLNEDIMTTKIKPAVVGQ